MELLPLLSDAESSRVGQIKNPLQAFNTSVGRILLARALVLIGQHEKMDMLQYGRYGKPFFPNSMVRFSISHTAGAVLCAISMEGSLGIDIERRRKIPTHRFKRFFSQEELAFIGDDEQRFVDLWSRKEALLKADGRGLAMHPGHYNSLRNPQLTDQKEQWYIQPLEVPEGYAASIALHAPNLPLEHLHIEQFEA